MATDWQGLATIVLLALLVVWVARWIGRQADRNMQLLNRRFGADPQSVEPANGTGVEPAPSDVSALPRSPRSPVVGEADPRPTAPTTGPQSPGGAVAIHAALPGLQPRRTVVHGGST